MALQVITGNASFPEVLVLDLNVKFHDDRVRMDEFVAEVYETSPQIVICDGCGEIVGRNTVFRGSGAGWSEFSSALSCFDLLRGKDYQTGIAKRMESRLLELQARGLAEYCVRFEICDKVTGVSEDIVQQITWHEIRQRYHHEQTSSFVVPEREIQEIREHGKIKNTIDRCIDSMER